MVMELIGSRLLAPYLGTSIFVWASLIGIILGALSLGYYLGGRLSKKNANLSFLTMIIMLAGISLVMIFLAHRDVLEWSMRLGVKNGSIVATLILFAFPSIILGIISPYAIRLKIENIEGSGKVAGNLYSLSTIGSIAGTFLAGFYLIPMFGSKDILIGLSITLFLTSLLAGRRILKIILIILTILLLNVYSLLPNGFVYEGDSEYNHIRVVKTQEVATMRNLYVLYLATETHSLIYEDSDDLFGKYHQIYRLDGLFKPEIKKALTLGGGAYVAPLDFLRRYPTAEMTVVEIDPKVTEVAKKYFRLKDDPRLKIVHDDARIFLNNNREKYDVIYGDAFASYYSIPFHLTTKESMEKIASALSDDGVFVLNVIASLDGPGSIFFQSEYLTLKQVFSQLYVFPAYYYQTENLDKAQNIVIFASNNPKAFDLNEFSKVATSNQKELLLHYWPNVITDQKAIILTDDFAPVDFYISKLLKS